MTMTTFLITGFHRSGTSLFTAYLKRAGLFVGHNLKPGEVLESGAWSGHHEDQAIMGFQETALRSRGLSLFPTDATQLPLHFTASEIDMARRLIADRAVEGTWGWKDPRTCLFLEAWNGLLDRAIYLFLLREPRQAVASLVRRNRDRGIVRNPGLGMQAWLVYNREILGFGQRHPAQCYLIDLDTFLASPETAIHHLNTVFGAELTPVPLFEVFDPQSLHREVSDALRSAVAQDPVPFDAADHLYRTLRVQGRQWGASKRSRSLWGPPEIRRST